LSWYRHNSGRNLCVANCDCASSADNVCFVVPPILHILFLTLLQFVIFLLLTVLLSSVLFLFSSSSSPNFPPPLYQTFLPTL
jgi:hypothetical protein